MTIWKTKSSPLHSTHCNRSNARSYHWISAHGRRQPNSLDYRTVNSIKASISYPSAVRPSIHTGWVPTIGIPNARFFHASPVEDDRTSMSASADYRRGAAPLLGQKMTSIKVCRGRNTNQYATRKRLRHMVGGMSTKQTLRNRIMQFAAKSSGRPSFVRTESADRSKI